MVKFWAARHRDEVVKPVRSGYAMLATVSSLHISVHAVLSAFYTPVGGFAQRRTGRDTYCEQPGRWQGGMKCGTPPQVKPLEPN